MNKITNWELYLEFKKTYLIFKRNLIEAIEKGDVKAAEMYPAVEECMQAVETWHFKEISKH